MVLGATKKFEIRQSTWQVLHSNRLNFSLKAPRRDYLNPKEVVVCEPQHVIWYTLGLLLFLQSISWICVSEKKVLKST